MSSSAGPSSSLTRPSVPRPTLERGQNLTNTVVKDAFGSEDWLERTGNWAKKLTIDNTMRLIQKICDEVYNQHEGQMSPSFTFQKQNTDIKDAMYNKFLFLLQTYEMEEDYRSLILDMLDATDPNEEGFRGPRWLFEVCMRRTWDNRSSRAKGKDPKAKKRTRGSAHFQPER
ncbi:hypothetical protein TWF970_010793 [Orbilia oligospora]|uniref:Uncharacterized protein n=1 Tax=Orbilia oligospora TaxID=2813651 RepID=A0A7C8R496_ORBOL|nr:hypothetical protein TWF970_010793 [Orbilia oligospora]